MAIKYINIFQSKALQNLLKLGFLVWKQTIWQPWLEEKYSGYLLRSINHYRHSRLLDPHFGLLKTRAGLCSIHVSSVSFLANTLVHIHRSVGFFLTVPKHSDFFYQVCPRFRDLWRNDSFRSNSRMESLKVKEKKRWKTFRRRTFVLTKVLFTQMFEKLSSFFVSLKPPFHTPRY
jgi:hypothetical protein